MLYEVITDARPRGLGLVGHDGELVADDAIEQRGLARVGTPEERDDAALHGVTPRDPAIRPSASPRPLDRGTLPAVV